MKWVQIWAKEVAEGEELLEMDWVEEERLERKQETNGISLVKEEEK